MPDDHFVESDIEYDADFDVTRVRSYCSCGYDFPPVDFGGKSYLNAYDLADLRQKISHTQILH